MGEVDGGFCAGWCLYGLIPAGVLLLCLAGCLLHRCLRRYLQRTRTVNPDTRAALIKPLEVGPARKATDRPLPRIPGQADAPIDYYPEVRCDDRPDDRLDPTWPQAHVQSGTHRTSLVDRLQSPPATPAAAAAPLDRRRTKRVKVVVVSPEPCGSAGNAAEAFGFTVVGPLTQQDVPRDGIGLFVAGVTPGSAAEAAGVRVGLQLVTVNHRPVTAAAIDALSAVFCRCPREVTLTGVHNLAGLRARGHLPHFRPSLTGLTLTPLASGATPTASVALSPVPQPDRSQYLYDVPADVWAAAGGTAEDPGVVTYADPASIRASMVLLDTDTDTDLISPCHSHRRGEIVYTPTPKTLRADDEEQDGDKPEPLYATPTKRPPAAM